MRPHSRSWSARQGKSVPSARQLPELPQLPCSGHVLLPDGSTTFNAGPAEIEALGAGAVDIGFIGPSPAVNG
ncbi:hypothetical protein AB0D15_20765, partial [Streptomyces sp. NPDC048551]